VTEANNGRTLNSALEAKSAIHLPITFRPSPVAFRGLQGDLRLAREGQFRRPLSFLWEAVLGTVLNSAPALARPLLSEDASLTANEPARRTVGVSRCSEAGVNAGISRASLQTSRLPTAFRAPTGPMTEPT
jgi:hypothetical protein